MRTLPLHAWLALALTLATAAPAAAGAGAWLAAGEWQADRERARLAGALELVAAADLAVPAQRAKVVERLARLDVEAELVSHDARKLEVKPAMDGKQVFQTPGLAALFDEPSAKHRIAEDYAQAPLKLSHVGGTLLVHKESASARWAIALGAGAAALAAALVAAVALLRRWVLRPLAQLAGEADRVAGGELDVHPVATPAREVAQVGDALQGMAGALEHALGASAAVERERRFLIGAIAHDLRTPLFTLRGSLEAIERGLDDGRALPRAQAKAAHLDRLVGDLFAFARAEYAHDRRALEPVDLTEIARRAAETVEPGPIRLDVVTNGAVPMRGDPVALERVVTNLLDNALRHARERVTLTVTAAAVEVTDDGPGFAPEDLPRVFEPLFRGDRARARGGAGLGLAIARRVVRAHGAEIVAANDPRGGARVTVTL